MEHSSELSRQASHDIVSLGSSCKTSGDNRTCHLLGSDEEFSDSDEEEEEEESEETLQKRDAESAAKECRSVLKRWWSYEVNWHEIYPNEGLPEKPDLIADLMPLDIGLLTRRSRQRTRIARSMAFSH